MLPVVDLRELKNAPLWIALAAAVTALVYAVGWLAAQGALASLAVGYVAVPREVGMWLGLIFVSTISPWIYVVAGWHREESQGFLSYLADVASVLVVCSFAATASMIGSRYQAELAIAWGGAIVVMVALTLCYALALHITKSRHYGVVAKIRARVEAVRLRIAEVDAELNNATTTDTRRRDLTAAREETVSALNATQNEFELSMRRLRASSLIYLLASGPIVMLGYYSQAIVPKLPQTVGGLEPIPVIVTLEGPNEVISGALLFSNDESVILVPESALDSPRPNVIVRIPLRRVSELATSPRLKARGPD